MDREVSKRIEGIISLVNAKRLCDVGCDHALLPITLINRSICDFAIAMDVASGPLKTAKENILRFGLSKKIETRISDGFSALKPGEADCAVIAGMGGLLIIDILKSNDVWKGLDTLIVSPHRDASSLRKYLGGECFYDTEIKVFEDKVFYPIMRFCPKKEPNVLSDNETEFGKNPPGDYLLYEKKVAADVLRNLELAKDSSKIAQKKEYYLSRIKEIEKLYETL